MRVTWERVMVTAARDKKAGTGRGKKSDVRLAAALVPSHYVSQSNATNLKTIITAVVFAATSAVTFTVFFTVTITITVVI
jgi:hypothetical protein